VFVIMMKMVVVVATVEVHIVLFLRLVTMDDNGKADIVMFLTMCFYIVVKVDIVVMYLKLAKIIDFVEVDYIVTVL